MPPTAIRLNSRVKITHNKYTQVLEEYLKNRKHLEPLRASEKDTHFPVSKGPRSILEQFSREFKEKTCRKLYAVHYKFSHDMGM